MKKYIIITAIFLTCIASFAQSKTMDLAGKTHSIIRREEVKLGTVKSVGEVSFYLSFLENLTTNEKMCGIGVATGEPSPYGPIMNGMIDYDEIDSCIDFLKQIRDKYAKTNPSNDIIIHYVTRDSVVFCASYYVKTITWDFTMSSNWSNTSWLKITSLNEIITILTKANAVLKEWMK